MFASLLYNFLLERKSFFDINTRFFQQNGGTLLEMVSSNFGWIVDL